MPSMNSGADLDVKELASTDGARWNAFVDRCSEATFFHRAEWREIIESVFHHRTHYLYAERAGDIVGILPLAHVASWLFGSSLTSLPFCVYGGAAVVDATARAALHRRARELASSLRVAISSFETAKSRSPAGSTGTCTRHFASRSSLNRMPTSRRYRVNVETWSVVPQKRAYAQSSTTRSSVSSRFMRTTCIDTARRRSQGITFARSRMLSDATTRS